MGDNIKGAAWAIGLWGALSIIFGLLIVSWPEITLKAFLVILGVYLLAAGAVAIIGSIADRSGHWVAGILLGALSVIAGLYVFSNPQMSALVTLYLIAIWAIAVGAILILGAFQAEKDGIWIGIAGVLSLLFGFYIFAEPQSGALALIWLIAIYSIVSGIFLAVGAFKLHGAGSDLAKATK